MDIFFPKEVLHHCFGFYLIMIGERGHKTYPQSMKILNISQDQCPLLFEALDCT